MALAAFLRYWRKQSSALQPLSTLFMETVLIRGHACRGQVFFQGSVHKALKRLYGGLLAPPDDLVWFRSVPDGVMNEHRSIEPCSASDRDQVANETARAIEISGHAMQLELAGDAKGAGKQWARLFGGLFPKRPEDTE